MARVVHSQVAAPIDNTQNYIKLKGLRIQIFRNPFLSGGAEGDRTPDLLNAIQALSHLSYNPGSPVS